MVYRPFWLVVGGLDAGTIRVVWREISNFLGGPCRLNRIGELNSSMKLSIVLGATNDNPHYYKFIPSQIQFWGYFGIKFVAVYVGAELPAELVPFKSHIIMWPHTPQLHSAYVAQVIRLFMPSLLCMPEDECVMITDMDMLPASPRYYIEGLDKFGPEDFVYYRTRDKNQLYMCYNAANSRAWATMFNIHSVQDVCAMLVAFYPPEYNVKSNNRWFADQLILYAHAENYPRLTVLERPLRRLEVNDYIAHLERGDTDFVKTYDDIHYHESFIRNQTLIQHALAELIQYQSRASF